MLPERRDLGQRGEGEAARGQARVGQGQVAKARHTASEVEDVAVDHARSVAKRRFPSAFALDAFQGRQQAAGRAAPSDLGDDVQKTRLPVEADGLARVHRRDARKRSESGDAGESGTEMGAAVAEIGTEADVDRAAGAVSTLLRPRAVFLRARALPR